MRIWKAAIAAGVLLCASTALAQDGNDWKFNFQNNSTYGVTAFATQLPSGQWSQNWLSGRLLAGQSKALAFQDSSDTRCKVLTRVTFDNDEYFEDSLDYCNKSTVTVTDSAMTVR